MHETKRLTLRPYDLTVGASVLSDAGCVRSANEDRCCHVEPRDCEVLSARGRLTIIADGMGGHSSGEIAAQMAVEVISEQYYSDREHGSPDALRLAIEAANREIYALSLANGLSDRIGTTLVALVVVNDRAFSAHVGDSRLYRMRGRKLKLLTVDHSQVMEMVGQGVITLDQARSHDDRNIILRAVGTQPEVEVDLSEEFEIEPGDTFLVCSDGLHDMVSDQVIEAIIASGADEHSMCEQLIASARHNGGHDNVTAGVVKIGAAALVPPPQVRITREIVLQ